LTRRFLYERGTFEQSYAVLEIAEAACEPLKDAEAIKADIHGGFGSLATETNQFQEAYDQFKLEYDNITTAIDRGFLTRPNVREAIAQGGIANGLNGLKKYAEAEKEYWKCIDIWRSCPGQATIYEINLSACLWLQDKFEEAEHLLKKIIIDPDDTTTYRTGHAMFTYGNVKISQAYELLANGEDEKGQAKLDEAFATHKKTLEHFRKILKDHHHKTADGHYKVGWHLHRLQQYQDAIKHLNSALGIYSGSSFYQNEIARTKYKLGCVLRDAGQEIEGRKTLLEAEELRKKILGSDCRPARTEEDYNDLLMFWSR
jgi:tetratricopeptide (TPR) repeat protein